VQPSRGVLRHIIYIYTVLVLGIKYNIILYSGVHANATTATTAATAVDSIISPGNLLSLAYDPPPSPLASDDHRPLTFSRPLSLYRNNIHAHIEVLTHAHNIYIVYIYRSPRNFQRPFPIPTPSRKPLSRRVRIRRKIKSRHDRRLTFTSNLVCFLSLFREIYIRNDPTRGVCEA